jgi:hypothetical protein
LGSSVARSGGGRKMGQSLSFPVVLPAASVVLAFVSVGRRKNQTAILIASATFTGLAVLVYQSWR